MSAALATERSTGETDRPLAGLCGRREAGARRHARVAKIAARALRDAGLEVISTSRHETPEQIVGTVIFEHQDAVGLSILSGAT